MVNSENSEPVRLTAEIGLSGLKEWGGLVVEEYDPDLRGIRAVKIYDEMRRNDPTVAMGLRLIKWVLGRIEWHVEPGGESAADKEAAEFLDTCRTDMSGTWSKFLRDALTCLDFGYSYLEFTLKQRNGTQADPPSRYDDGRIGWRKFTLLGHDSLAGWDFDERGTARGFIQQVISGYTNFSQVTVPIEKSLLFRLDDEKDNPEGVSLLRCVYDSYYKKKNIEEIEAIGIERDLTGVLIIHPPVSASTTDKDKAVQLLEQFKNDDMAGFVAPQFGEGDHEKWRFEIINSPGNKTIDTDKVIQRYDLRIARAFLAQFLMLGQSSVGSFALSKDMSDVFEVALGAIVQNLEETINRFAVPPLFRLNDFGKLTALPQIKAGKVSHGDLDKFATSLKTLADGGLLTASPQLEQFIRQEMELPEMTEEEMEAQEEAKEAARQNLENMAKQTPTEPGKGDKPGEDTGDEEPEEFSEDPDDFALPDPDDDSWWDKFEEESNKRLAEYRSFASLLRFAKPYDYEAKLQERANIFRQEMQDLARQLREGSITVRTWEQRSREKILVNTADAYKLGAAKAQGLAPSKVKLSNEQRKAAVDAGKAQLDYFAKFAKEVRGKIAAGETLTTAVDARSTMYGGSVRGTLHDAWLAESDPKQKLTWRRTKSDSCSTCLKMDGKSKTIEKWLAGGILPAKSTKCLTNCGCSLEPVAAKVKGKKR